VDRLFAAVTTVGVLLGLGGVRAQPADVVNAFEGNPDAIRAGMAFYRVRCADCHGDSRDRIS